MSAATGNDDCLSLLAALDLDADFYMYSFKVIPCSKVYSHKWTVCPCAHAGETARRRCPRTTSYRAVLCPLVKAKKTCPMGDACTYSHSVFEHWLHPSRYKTRLCTFGGGCNRPICFFAHSAQELRAASAEMGQEGRGEVEHPAGQDFLGPYGAPGFGAAKYGQQLQHQQQHQQQQVKSPVSSDYSVFGNGGTLSGSPQHPSASQNPDSNGNLAALGSVGMQQQQQRSSHNGGRQLNPSSSSSRRQHNSENIGPVGANNGPVSQLQQQQQLPQNRVSLQGLADLMSTSGSQYASQQLQQQQLAQQLQLQQQQQVAANNLLLNMIVAGLPPTQASQQRMSMPLLPSLLDLRNSGNGSLGHISPTSVSLAGADNNMLPSLSDLDAASMLNMLNDLSGLNSGLTAPNIAGGRGMPLGNGLGSSFGTSAAHQMMHSGAANVMLSHHSAYGMQMHDPLEQYGRLSDPGNASYGMSLYSASNLPPNVTTFGRASESGAAFLSAHGAKSNGGQSMTSRLEHLLPLSATLSPSHSGPLSPPGRPFLPGSHSGPVGLSSSGVLGGGSGTPGGAQRPCEFQRGRGWERGCGPGHRCRAWDRRWRRGGARLWQSSGDVLSVAQQQHQQQVQAHLQQQMWPASSAFSDRSDRPHSGSGSSSATQSSLHADARHGPVPAPNRRPRQQRPLLHHIPGTGGAPPLRPSSPLGRSGSPLLGRSGSPLGRSGSPLSRRSRPLVPPSNLVVNTIGDGSSAAGSGGTEAQNCDATLDTLRSQMQAQGLVGTDEQLVASLTQLLAQLTAKIPSP
ncbi:MAG: hypothetical protein WDW36_002883 [Sanguina aurantia]